MKKLIALVVVVMFVLSMVGISYAGNNSTTSKSIYKSSIGKNVANAQIVTGGNTYQSINSGGTINVNSNRSTTNTKNTIGITQKNTYAPKSVSGSNVYGRIF